jgi:hypothetical protein
MLRFANKLVMLNAVMLNAECCYDECCFDECHYAECNGVFLGLRRCLGNTLAYWSCLFFTVVIILYE